MSCDACILRLFISFCMFDDARELQFPCCTVSEPSRVFGDKVIWLHLVTSRACDYGKIRPPSALSEQAGKRTVIGRPDHTTGQVECG